MLSPVGVHLVDLLRNTVRALDSLEPAERDYIVGVLLADLRSRSAVLSEWPATEAAADPRGAK